MAKQIRIDDDAFNLLESIAARTAKPKSVCASLILEAFEQLLSSMQEGSQLVIENGDERTKIVLPFRTRGPTKAEIRTPIGETGAKNLEENSDPIRSAGPNTRNSQ